MGEKMTPCRGVLCFVSPLRPTTTLFLSLQSLCFPLSSPYPLASVPFHHRIFSLCELVQRVVASRNHKIRDREEGHRITSLRHLRRRAEKGLCVPVLRLVRRS